MTISPRVRAWLLLGGAVALVLLALLLARGNDSVDRGGDARPAVTSTAAPKPSNPGAVGQPSASAPAKVAGVPDRAYLTLVEIDAGRWPDSAGAPGTRGGDTYFNRNRALPARDAAGKNISYREWDVNPKRRGQDRGAERIVTGSDGSAWYTADHYDTFTRMR
ncbi:ribonuclease domain-containing protein [Nocardia sp. NPDC003693]